MDGACIVTRLTNEMLGLDMVPCPMLENKPPTMYRPGSPAAAVLGPLLFLFFWRQRCTSRTTGVPPATLVPLLTRIAPVRWPCVVKAWRFVMKLRPWWHEKVSGEASGGWGIAGDIRALALALALTNLTEDT